MEPYPLYDIGLHDSVVPTEESTSIFARQRQSEQMGSKEKFWFCNTATSRWHLFKYARPKTGEHWSEKVACEIARALGLPHAQVELAFHNDAPGALVEDFRSDRVGMSLLHGNELLLELDPQYPSGGGYRVSEHTVARVRRALVDHEVNIPNPSTFTHALPDGVKDAWGLFIGYLFLDALIGNTDRHHENWAVIAQRKSEKRTLTLAPTYDHASSLGRELSDERRRGRLTGPDEHGIDSYARRARSALYKNPADKKPLSAREAFLIAGDIDPIARAAWLSRCREVRLSVLTQTVTRVPATVASSDALAFATQLLICNYRDLSGNAFQESTP